MLGLDGSLRAGLGYGRKGKFCLAEYGETRADRRVRNVIVFSAENPSCFLRSRGFPAVLWYLYCGAARRERRQGGGRGNLGVDEARADDACCELRGPESRRATLQAQGLVRSLATRHRGTRVAAEAPS